VPLEAWREQVLRELKGAPPERLIARVEGLEIEPLYPAVPRALPGREGLLRAPGWTVCPETTHPDPAAAGAAIARDLQRGAGAVWVRLDERLAAGVAGPPAPTGLHGVVVRDVEALASLIVGVDVRRTPVTLAVGAAGRGVSDAAVGAGRARRARARGAAWAARLRPARGAGRTVARWPGRSNMR
jgi:hypothetical protein